MPEKLSALNEHDVKALQGYLDTLKRQVRRSTPTPPDAQDHPAPETYVVRTPSGGIPGRVNAVPGVAACTVYRLLKSAGVTALSPLALDKLVYNLSSDAIEGELWITAHRDKFGHWIVSVSAGSGDDSETETGTGTGTGTATDSTLCPRIPGVDFDDLDVTETPDYVLAIVDGCLSRVAVAECAGAGTGTSGGTAELSIGATVTGGIESYVLYVGTGGVLAQSSLFTFDGAKLVVPYVQTSQTSAPTTPANTISGPYMRSSTP